MTNPYKIEGPAVISFSGGRSSGFMLWKILEAYDHKLPDDIKVVFCNTGLEHHETYEFIHRIEENWCDITWLEYTRKDPNWIAKGEPSKNTFYKITDYKNSSREGEPFEELIFGNKPSSGSNFLPNERFRLCTSFLKIQAQILYLKKELGWTEWTKAVGLRHDEPRRVNNIKPWIKCEEISTPMHLAIHDKHDVHEFWNNHPLDLKLTPRRSIYGNCVGCFLKGYSTLEMIAREEPKHLDWWIKIESKLNDRFSNKRPNYETIKRDAHLQQAFDFGDTIDCFCTD